MLAPGSKLQKRPGLVGPILVVLFAAGGAAAIAYIIGNVPAAVSICVGAVALLSAVIVFHLRNRERNDSADLYLLRVHGVLGWPEPHRSQVTPSRYRGGWIGHPTVLDIAYNPLADEEVPEILAEVRRLARRQFGDSPFTVVKHKRNRVRLRSTWQNPDDRARDERITRAKLVIAKTFGTGASTKVETASDPRTQNGTTITSTKITRITVKYEVTPKLSRSGIRASVESQISGVLEGRWRAFWDLPNDTFWMEPRPELPAVIPNPSIAPDTVDPLASYDDLAVPVGVDEDGNTISWRPKHDAHVLTTGKTGKGKTVCLLGITEYVAAHGWEVWGIDGKRFEMLGLRTWPNICLIAGRIDHQARVAHAVYTEMQRRMASYEAGEIRLEEFVPLMLVIDEFKTFRNALLRWYRTVKPKGPGTQPPVLDEISDIASLGRKMRIHIVIGLQRPDADFLTGDMRDNFAFRLSWGRLSAEGAKMMWNNFVTGTTIPTTARGRGIAYNRQGQPVEIQGYWTPDPYQTEPDRPDIWVFDNDLELVQNMRPKQRIQQLKKIVEIDTDPTFDDNGKPVPVDYYDYMDAPIIDAGDPELIERERKALGAVEADARREREAARVTELARIQTEEEELEVSDELERFDGYSPAADQFAEELLTPSGDLFAEGILLLVDEDTDTWGLLEHVDDEDEGCITFSFKNFDTGEPGAKTIPTDLSIITRSPVAAGV